MDDIIYEIEVDDESVIIELPVNADNIIELDYTYLEVDDDENDFDDETGDSMEEVDFEEDDNEMGEDEYDDGFNSDF